MMRKVELRNTIQTFMLRCCYNFIQWNVYQVFTSTPWEDVRLTQDFLELFSFCPTTYLKAVQIRDISFDFFDTDSFIDVNFSRKFKLGWIESWRSYWLYATIPAK